MKNHSDERDDVVNYLVPFVREAHRQTDLVSCFLKALDVPPRTPLTPDLLLKIAAFVRIYQWERSGVRRCFRPTCPRPAISSMTSWGSPIVPDLPSPDAN